MRLKTRQPENPAALPFSGCRRGFTLIELLVVIAIIAVLTALGAAAYFATVNRQQRNNTHTGLQALDKMVSQHWNFVRAEAEKEEIPATVKSFFGLGSTDQKRARVIWVKLRLMEAFPQSFAEILDQDNSFAPYKAGLIPFGSRKNLPQYKKKLQVAQANGASPKNDETESAACLFLALSVSRGGAKLEADTLGSGYIQDTNKDGIDEIVDGWQKAVRFYRFPTNNNDLQTANPHKAGTKGEKHADPLDPDGLLLRWPGPGRTAFETIVHPISPDGARAFYVIPVLVSAGKDTEFGLGPTMNVADPSKAEDNLYSYQLRQ